MKSARLHSTQLWLLLGGFTIWAAAFTATYSVNAVACALQLHRIGVEPFTLQRLLLAALFLLSVAGLALGTLRLVRRARQNTAPQAHGFLLSAGVVAWLAATGAAIFTLAPVLFVSTCT